LVGVLVGAFLVAIVGSEVGSNGCRGCCYEMGRRWVGVEQEVGRERSR
jgi:hypothetical protein